MAIAGKLFCTASSSAAMAPSGARTLTVMLATGTPRGRLFTISSIIDRITIGTPAMTKTFPMRKPGAAETAFFTRVPPSGTRAMRLRASLKSAAP